MDRGKAIADEEADNKKKTAIWQAQWKACEKMLNLAEDYHKKYCIRRPMTDCTLRGEQWLAWKLEGNPRKCRKYFRMDKFVFDSLCTELQEFGLEPTKHVSVKEQVATFLMAVGQKHNFVTIEDRLQRGGATIHNSMHNVLDVCDRMARKWIRPFQSLEEIPEYLLEHPKYLPYFQNCVGAIDGTLIHAAVPSAERRAFFSRKDDNMQNMMAVCDFDLRFTFVYAGWEGSAHDMRLFWAAVRNPENRFPDPPEGKYYLVDAGYSNQRGFLAPYKGCRYHQAEFDDNYPKYVDKREVFNHLHSSLRSHIERTFGVWKNRFRLISDMPHGYAFPDQVRMVVATMAIHNFIRTTDRDDEDFEKAYVREPEPRRACRDAEESGVRDRYMDNFRDAILQNMLFDRRQSRD